MTNCISMCVVSMKMLWLDCVVWLELLNFDDVWKFLVILLNEIAISNERIDFNAFDKFISIYTISCSLHPFRILSKLLKIAQEIERQKKTRINHSYNCRSFVWNHAKCMLCRWIVDNLNKSDRSMIVKLLQCILNVRECQCFGSSELLRNKEKKNKPIAIFVFSLQAIHFHSVGLIFWFQ